MNKKSETKYKYIKTHQDGMGGGREGVRESNRGVELTKV
jgi:hypothetical protein